MVSQDYADEMLTSIGVIKVVFEPTRAVAVETSRTGLWLSKDFE